MSWEDEIVQIEVEEMHIVLDMLMELTQLSIVLHIDGMIVA